MVVTVGDSIWISQAVLWLHYAVYLPVLLRDDGCTTRALWGPFGPRARAATLACAGAAYASMLVIMWSMRRETHAGLWASALAFFVFQSAFLPAVHDSNCRGVRSYVTRAVLAGAAASITWFVATTWRVSASRLAKYASLFLLVPFVVIDFLVYAWVSVPYS